MPYVFTVLSHYPLNRLIDLASLPILAIWRKEVRKISICQLHKDLPHLLCKNESSHKTSYSKHPSCIPKTLLDLFIFFHQLFSRL